MPAPKHDEQTKPRILRIASELFYERGITSTGVDTIAKATDVAKTTMYSHFGSKDGLVAAYLEARGAAWRAHLATAVRARTSDPAGRVLAVFDVLADWMAEEGYRGCPFINATAELCDPEHPGRVATRAHRDALRADLRELAAEAGVADPEETAARLLLLYDAAMVEAQLDGDPQASARRAREAAAALLPAVQSEESGGPS